LAWLSGYQYRIPIYVVANTADEFNLILTVYSGSGTSDVGWADCFQRSNADDPGNGWVEAAGDYDIVDGTVQYQAGSGGSWYANPLYNTNTQGKCDWDDRTYIWKIKPTSTNHDDSVLLWIDSSHFYMIYATTSDNTLRLCKNGTSAVQTASYTPTSDWQWIKVKTSSSHYIRVKMWIDGHPEPTNWMIQWQDSSPLTLSNAMLAMGVSDAASASPQWDDVQIAPSENKIYLNGHAQAFPNDIRFTDSDGSTLLNHFTYDTDSSSYANIAVEIPAFSSGTKTIYLYYGKSDDTSASTDSAILFFDDFESGLGKWTIESGDPAQSTTQKYEGSYSVYLMGTNSTYDNMYVNLGKRRFRISAWQYNEGADETTYSENAMRIDFMVDDTNYDKRVCWGRDHYKTGETYYYDIANLNTWEYWEKDLDELIYNTGQDWSAVDHVRLRLLSIWNSTKGVYFDYIFVYKLADNTIWVDTLWAGVGSEETPTAEVDIGLRYYDGTSVKTIACTTDLTNNPLRIHKNGTTYAIVLVDPTDASASKIRIKTPSGIKAWKEL